MRVVKNYHTLTLITHQGRKEKKIIFVRYAIFLKKIDNVDVHNISNCKLKKSLRHCLT